MSRIALIGDSHSQIHFTQLIPSLEESGNEIVFQSSKPGWGIKKFLSTSELDGLADTQPSIAIVALGGNNFNLNEEKYKGQIDEFVAFLKGIGVDRIVWMGPFESDPVTKASVQERHQWTADLQDAYLPSKGVFWIDMRPMSEGLEWRDGVHFSAPNYKIIVERMLKPLLSYVSSPLIFLRPHRSPIFWTLLVATLSIGGYFIVRRIRTHGSRY